MPESTPLQPQRTAEFALSPAEAVKLRMKDSRYSQLESNIISKLEQAAVPDAIIGSVPLSRRLAQMFFEQQQLLGLADCTPDIEIVVFAEVNRANPLIRTNVAEDPTVVHKLPFKINRDELKKLAKPVKREITVC